MARYGDPVRVFVPSLHRPQNVPTMAALAGEAELVWCVPPEEEQAYRDAGAQHVHLGHPGEFEKMNEVMDAYPDEWVTFSDDDCTGFWRLEPDGDIVNITLGEAVAEMLSIAAARRDKFVCISMNSNRTFMRRTITDWGQPANWLCSIAPGVPERWEVAWGSDVDFAAKMFMAYGRIARVNHIIGAYQFGNKDSLWNEWYRSEPAQDARLRELAARYPALMYHAGPGKLKYRRLKAA